MTQNEKEQFITDLYQIELALMYAQQQVFEKRLELLNKINDMNRKGAESLSQIAHSDQYNVPMVPSLLIDMPMKRTKIIDLENTSPHRVPKISLTTGQNKSRKNENNSVNTNAMEQEEQVEIEECIPYQIQKLFKIGKYDMKNRLRDEESNCRVCDKSFSSGAAVNRHLRVFHRIEKNWGFI